MGAVAVLRRYVNEEQSFSHSVSFMLASEDKQACWPPPMSKHGKKGRRPTGGHIPFMLMEHLFPHQLNYKLACKQDTCLVVV
jgi:hypothetical protein